MECLSTINSLKINLKKNIGTILIVVEGGSDEFELFKHIFRDILHYKYTEKTRLKSKFKNYEFVMKGNESSRVIVINAKNSNINTLKKDKEYLNDIYIDLYNEIKKCYPHVTKEEFIVLVYKANGYKDKDIKNFLEITSYRYGKIKENIKNIKVI